MYYGGLYNGVWERTIASLRRVQGAWGRHFKLQLLQFLKCGPPPRLLISDSGIILLLRIPLYVYTGPKASFKLFRPLGV